MFMHGRVISLFSIFLGGMCLSFSFAYSQNTYQNMPQDIRPGVSDDRSYPQHSPSDRGTEREEIAYMDERERQNIPHQDYINGVTRMGDWGYKSNWRYDRRAFFKGETQNDAYDEEHPYGYGGIGYDSDPEYLHMRRFYREDVNRSHQNAYNTNDRNPNNRSNFNNRMYANQQRYSNHPGSNDSQNPSHVYRGTNQVRNHYRAYEQGYPTINSYDQGEMSPYQEIGDNGNHTGYY